jgi:3-hydroxyisobutyrate dehydrogenase-like beta-hydroxyacid dehydrogenase
LVNNMMTLGTYALAMEAMQLGAAYGLDEDTITRVVTSSQGDSRVMRTWGRMDRIRRERFRGADGQETYAYMGKDLREAAIAGGLRGVPMPMAAVAADILPAKMGLRDRLLDQRPGAPIPRCRGCDQELAALFWDAGTHPECAGA